MGQKPYPFTPEQLAWLHDLETTTEPQTVGALHRVVKTEKRSVGYCCLGLGAKALGLRESPWSEDENLVAFHGSSTQLIPFHRLCLRDGSGGLLYPVPHQGDPDTWLDHNPEGWLSLADLNDELRWSFPEIAAYCREHPWNVFTDPHASHDDGCPWSPKTGESCSCDFFKRDFSL